MRVLVTGASGFSGTYLVELLRRGPEIELFCADQEPNGEAHSYSCDLGDTDSVRQLLSETRPQQIYHLVGSFTNEFEVDYRANVATTRNILQSVLEGRLNTRILLVGSSAEYGRIRAGGNPVGEEEALSPLTVYGLVKVFQTCLMRFFFTRYGLDIVMARTFNLFGKGISSRLFPGRVNSQIEAFKRGEVEEIIVGNLENKRDYIHVREAVAAYRLIMERGIAGEIYNVGSGKPTLIRDLLVSILQEAGLDLNVVRELPEQGENEAEVREIFADVRKLDSLRTSANSEGGKCR